MSKVRFQKTLYLGQYERTDLSTPLKVTVRVTIDENRFVKFLGLICAANTSSVLHMGQLQNLIIKELNNDKHKQLLEIWSQLHMNTINDTQLLDLKEVIAKHEGVSK